MNQTRDLGMSHEHLPWLVLAGVASPIILFVASMAVAAGRPEYSHLRQTFSELGTRGRPGAIWMNWLGIVPAIVIGVAAVMFIFSRRAQSSAYTQAEGQPGAAAYVLGQLRGDWRSRDFCSSRSPLCFLLSRLDPVGGYRSGRAFPSARRL